MNKTDLLRALKTFFLETLPKCLLFYVLAPLLCVLFLSRPVSEAACRSDTAAFLILLAVLGAVLLNWLAYKAVRRKRPSLLVYSHGILCLLLFAYIEHEALPADGPLCATMAMVCGSLIMLYLLILSHWFASHRSSKPSLVIAVGLRIAFGVILFFMACQIYRDYESRRVTRDTWITVGILAALLLAAASPKLLASVRLSNSRRRATGETTGVIDRIIGETHLDLDDDPVTLFHCSVLYTVGGVPYETRADVTRHTLRRYGKENFLGRKIPVFYNPDDPASAFTDPIDRHILDLPREKEDEDPAEKDPASKEE